MAVRKYVLPAAMSLLLPLAFPSLTMAAPITVVSPDGSITIKIETVIDGQLTWSVDRQNRSVLLPAPLGLAIDGKEIGHPVTLGTPTIHAIDEKYRTIGNHSQAINHCNEAVIPAESAGIKYEIDARAYDDGVAVRISREPRRFHTHSRRRTNFLGTAR